MAHDVDRVVMSLEQKIKRSEDRVELVASVKKVTADNANDKVVL